MSGFLRGKGAKQAAFLLPFLAAVAPEPALAADSGWETLTDCRLISTVYHDADSFRISNGKEELTVRLCFVDAPESDAYYKDRVAEQAQYFGITLKETVALGKTATEFTERFLSGKFTVFTQRKDAKGKGKRYQAIVQKEGELLSLQLAANGLVRIRGFETKSRWPGGYDPKEMKAKLRELEQRAREEGVGGWGKKLPSLPPESKPMPVPEKIPDSSTGEKGARSTVNHGDPISRPRDFSRFRGRINLNHAPQTVLEQLPGIGPVSAQRIVENRPYGSLDELNRIEGIGPKTINKLASSATVVAPPAAGRETADFYRENPWRARNGPVPVLIGSLRETDLPAPDGFALLAAHTVSAQGDDGGIIPLFVPDEGWIEKHPQVFAQPSPKPVRTEAYFHNFKGTDILVIHHKR